MKRRRVLAAVALSVSAGGCLGDGTDGQGDTGSPIPSPTGSEQAQTDTTEMGTETDPETEAETDTPPSEGAVPGCWPNMCEGTQIVAVTVSAGFSGPVVLEAGCRGETVSLQGGESARIDREEDGERCPVTLSIDDEQVYHEEVGGYERVTISVDANGDIETEWVVY